MANVRQASWDGSPVYELENGTFLASLIPEIGSNAYRLRDKIAGRDVLRTPERPEELRASPGHYGVPLLLPPSRIRGASFPFNGRTYRFEPNTPDGHYIHGFVRMRPWRVVDTSADGDTASVTTEFRTADFPELAPQYPHDLTIRARTELNGASFVQTFSFRNGSDEPAPFGFGLHTWFLLDGEPERWTLKLPVSDIWELNEKLLATGSRLPLGRYEALNEGMNLEGQNMDMAFRIGDRPVEAVLSKPGYAIRYSANEPVTQWVVYTKGEARDTICIEPLTWTPDAPNLDAGPELTGMRAIAPGEELIVRTTLSIERE
ncbi:aldose 1-epimerase [Paenibacillus flagellatus]|uniref:Aldose epimerase n=1 Tax=Paenibacillus flagellatus TaxID=2211139 RepID=A0A2V5JZP0_9BACL|nr:aldose 1-epimerase [Paenibacillus flagellatus]PYI50804.1 aldose epimerase [Paenibacillus flagellatus]